MGKSMYGYEMIPINLTQSVSSVNPGPDPGIRIQARKLVGYTRAKEPFFTSLQDIV